MSAPLATVAALAGAADTVAFLAARPQMWSESPQRAGGSAGFAALWLAVAACSTRQQRRPAVALAAVCAAANAAMLAVHLRAGIASPRIHLGAALSGVALLAAAAGR